MSVAMPFIQAAMYLKQQDTAKLNEEIAQGQAHEAGAQSLTEEGIQRQQSREFLDRQSAAIGEAGIGHGGSAEKIQQQSVANAELDALTLRYQGQLRRFAYQQQASNYRAQGTQYGLLAAGSVLKGTAGFAGYGGGA